jgi:hypothetical protein
MTKNKIVLLILLTLPGVVLAQMDSYRYKRKLQSVAAKNWYTVKLPPALTARTLETMNDLRLFRVTGDTTEIPNLIQSLEEKNDTAVIPMTVLNRGTDPSGNYYFTLSQSNKRTINQIELDIPDGNLDWNCAIEGSDDQSRWLTIRENMRIVKIENEFVNYHYTTLNFPESNYNFFRVRIAGASKKNSLNAILATVRSFRPVPASYDTLDMADWNVTQDKKEKKTVILITLKERYAVNRIQLKIRPERDFYRNVTAYALRDSVKTPKGFYEDWNNYQFTVISSLEPNTIAGSAVRTKKIKLEIVNRNDQPLMVEGITVLGVSYAVTAELAPGQNYWLVYGKSADERPNYDLVYFKDKIPANPASITLGDELTMAFPEEPTSPWFGSRWWIWAVMALVIVILGAMSLSMLRKAKN